ncbi:hypothetical protein SAMN02990966_04252 [Rhodospirillales bacterium URHD0017]|nr:hypothetical protein SAMN02990966_04252 [Rhodospirillales bacterium URHD0017]
MRLSFSEVLSESFGFFFANLRLFFDLVTIPWIISVAIRMIGALVAIDSPLGALVEKAIDVVPTAMFVVAWQRLVLLGPHRIDRLPGLGWSARETAWLGHLLKVAGMTFLLMAVFMFTVGPMDPRALQAGATIDPDMARRYTLAGPLAFGFIVSMLLALRVSFGLAATAVDVPFSPRLSWAHSRGNAWPIIGALFVVYFGGAFVTALIALLAHGVMRGVLQADEAAAVVSFTVAILVSYAVIALTATVQAVIFRRLLAWREGVGLPAVTES